MTFTTFTTNHFQVPTRLWTVAPTGNINSRLNRTFLNREDARNHRNAVKAEGYAGVKIFTQRVTITDPVVDTKS